ncbi:MAG: THUMP domain-containing protein, partial [Clostridiales bacterium]
MKQLILIRYGELGLKGKNKNQFISRLVNNIRVALIGVEGFTVRSTWGRIWVEVEQSAYTQAVQCLKNVFGIYSMSPVVSVDRNLKAITEAAYQVLCKALPTGGIFKVETRRADKTFPMHSPDISREVANELFDRLDERYQADMHHPEFTLNIEIRG